MGESASQPGTENPISADTYTGHSLPVTAFKLSRAMHLVRLGGTTVKIIMRNRSSLIAKGRRCMCDPLTLQKAR